MIVTKQSKNLKEAKELKAPQGFEKVNVLTWHLKESRYAPLCPYVLKTDGCGPVWSPPGVIFENWWQSSKLFPKVYPITVKPNHMSSIVWWQYPHEEEHLKDGWIQREYFRWRDSIHACPHPIRYPNGYRHRGEVKFSISYDSQGFNPQKLDYLSARIELYVKEYIRLIRKESVYWELVKKLRQGVHLCITEVDVPAKGKSGVHGDVDEDGYFEATLNGVNELMYDTSALALNGSAKLNHLNSSPFGHGMCLVGALLEDV